MHYVNFSNEQTFHLYRFLSTRPGGYVHQLVACAFDLASTDESVDDHGPTAVLLERIALLVAEHVKTLAFDGQFGLFPEERGELEIGDECDGTPESLFLPILWNALASINYYAVAEAILRDKGKWAPEKVLAEIDEDSGDGGGGGAKVPV